MQDGEAAFFVPFDERKDAALELTTVEQENIKEICDKLGVEVAFENLLNINYKGKEISPDGYVGADGVLHINTFAQNPISFVFKHELAHFCERIPQKYKEFAKEVTDSEAFNEWIKEKTGKEYYWEALEEYSNYILTTDNSLNEYDENKINREIIADFVSEMMFTDGGSGMVAYMATLENKPRNIVAKMLRDFISWLKKIFIEHRYITLELSRLEDAFVGLIDDAVNSQNYDYANRADDVSFCFARCNNNNLRIKAIQYEKENMSRNEIYEKLGIFRSVFGDWVRPINTDKYKVFVDGNARFTDYKR